MTIAAAGMSARLAHAYAYAARAASAESLLADTRYASLQHVQAPIAYLDAVPPFPLPTHPAVPLPGDPGGYGTAAGLEDL